ncbi:hypothetical protein MUG91_G36n25 [Manis pentadactyla]|nr:hypothetical protein MUG91_G36n25 [Manis pentadactyla]
MAGREERRRSKRAGAGQELDGPGAVPGSELPDPTEGRGCELLKKERAGAQETVPPDLGSCQPALKVGLVISPQLFFIICSVVPPPYHICFRTAAI